MALDLCTLDDVKNSPAMDKLRRATTDTYDDEYLQILIKGFSSAAENYTGRFFELGAYTEVFSVCNQRIVQLRAIPVDSITSVTEDLNGNFAGGSVLSTNDYTLVDGGRSGIVKMRYRPFTDGEGCLQVVYVGGYDEDQIPDDLRLACIDQVAYRFRAAPTAHTASEGQNSGTASYRDSDLLPHVRATLNRYAIPRWR